MNACQSPLALVTGAASGIGKATSQRLLAADMRVIALDCDQATLDELAVESVGGALMTRQFDLARIVDIPSLVDELTSTYGPVTRLVNNAGIWSGCPIVEMTDQMWHANLTVNVTAPFALMRSLASVMAAAGGGAMVNVASRNAFRASTNNAAYCASKAALVALTRTAAGEFARHHIRVNSVCPGVIDTPADPSIEEPLFKAAYTRQIPLNRYGQPKEVANVIAFLLSDDASFVTGESVIIDGGQIACQDNERFMEIPGLKKRHEGT